MNMDAAGSGTKAWIIVQLRKEQVETNHDSDLDSIVKCVGIPVTAWYTCSFKTSMNAIRDLTRYHLRISTSPTNLSLDILSYQD